MSYEDTIDNESFGAVRSTLSAKKAYRKGSLQPGPGRQEEDGDTRAKL
jgi:hypothetical protein